MLLLFFLQFLSIVRSKLSGTSTHGKIGNCLIESKYGVITPLRLMGCNDCFFPSRYFVNTPLNGPDQKTDKTSACMEVLILADDQLINSTD